MKREDLTQPIELLEWYRRQDEFLTNHKAVLYLLSHPSRVWVSSTFIESALAPIGKGKIRKAMKELVDINVISVTWKDIEDMDDPFFADKQGVHLAITEKVKTI